MRRRPKPLRPPPSPPAPFAPNSRWMIDVSADRDDGGGRGDDDGFDPQAVEGGVHDAFALPGALRRMIEFRRPFLSEPRRPHGNRAEGWTPAVPEQPGDTRQLLDWQVSTPSRSSETATRQPAGDSCWPRVRSWRPPDVPRDERPRSSTSPAGFIRDGGRFCGRGPRQPGHGGQRERHGRGQCRGVRRPDPPGRRSGASENRMRPVGRGPESDYLGSRASIRS